MIMNRRTYRIYSLFRFRPKLAQHIIAFRTSVGTKAVYRHVLMDYIYPTILSQNGGYGHEIQTM